MESPSIQEELGERDSKFPIAVGLLWLDNWNKSSLQSWLHLASPEPHFVWEQHLYPWPLSSVLLLSQSYDLLILLNIQVLGPAVSLSSEQVSFSCGTTFSASTKSTSKVFMLLDSFKGGDSGASHKRSLSGPCYLPSIPPIFPPSALLKSLWFSEVFRHSLVSGVHNTVLHNVLRE